jgi:hypothetical protein
MPAVRDDGHQARRSLEESTTGPAPLNGPVGVAQRFFSIFVACHSSPSDVKRSRLASTSHGVPA